MKRNLITIIIILAAISGVIGAFYYQKNTHSKEDLIVEILGPTEVDLAEEVEFTVKYKNTGELTLEDPVLTFIYPENSLIDGGGFLIKTIELEDIYPFQEGTESFKARLFGKDGDMKVVKAEISYHLKNINIVFDRSTEYNIVIKSASLTLNFDIPKKIESGKDIRIKLNYFSNVNYPLSDLRSIINYPSDFEVKETIPESLGSSPIGDDEWDIGLLNRAEGGRIEILGSLSGLIGEDKMFEAKIGIWQNDEFIIIKEERVKVRIEESAIIISQKIHGNSWYIANPGDLLQYEISFRNVGDESATDLSLTVKLEGDMFDLDTIGSPKGKFKKGENLIRWDGDEVSDLRFLYPQEEGIIEFWVELKDNLPVTEIENRNPVIRTKVYLSQAQEEFVTKVNSKLIISQKGYFQNEFFGNTGPIPPEVGKDTTYAIIWQAKNYYSEVKDVKVKATLPKNVKLTGKIFPEEATESFTFDSKSKEIVWSLGDLPIGKGVLSSAPNIAFQVAIAPSSSQKDETPEIIGEAIIRGEDSWTEQSLKESSSAINTTLPDDSSVTEEQGIVQ